MMSRLVSALLLGTLLLAASLSPAQNAVGIFENHADVGAVLHPDLNLRRGFGNLPHFAAAARISGRPRTRLELRLEEGVG